VKYQTFLPLSSGKIFDNTKYWEEYESTGTLSSFLEECKWHIFEELLRNFLKC
jgi:hypothetical protein